MTSVYLVAGEASGDRLGAALIEGLKRLDLDVTFDGVGGPAMEAAGLRSLFPMDELSVMGIAEVLPRLRGLLRRRDETVADIVARAPDVLVTIDSPDFTLRVAAGVRAAAPGIRIVHYVAPSVWAWRPGRAAKMARHVDQVLTLLPFEPPYMQAAGMRADFVGHPVATEPRPSADEIATLRAELGLGDARVLVVLPGSRRGEVSRLLPVFGGALDLVVQRHPDLRVLVPAAAGVASDVSAGVAAWPGRPVVLDPRGRTPAVADMRKRAAFALAEAALAASGTVSLELAAATCPTVIAYDMNWISWQIMSRLARIDTVTLVNIVTGRRSVPEYLGPRCRPEAIAGGLLRLLDDSVAREDQVAAMVETMTALGQGGEPPGLRAARAVLDGLGSPPPLG
jgi:lipid-A-disaccharide synthase